MKKLILIFLKNLSSQSRKAVLVIIILVLISSVLELVSLGAVIPFLSILADPENFKQNEMAQRIINVLNIDESSVNLMSVSLLLFTSIMISATTRIIVIRFNWKVVFNIGTEISSVIFNRILKQELLFYKKLDTSKLISALSVKITNVIFGGLIPVIRLFSGILFTIIISSLLFYYSPRTYLFTLIFCLFTFGLISKVIRQGLTQNSDKISRVSVEVVRHMRNAIGNIRDIILRRNYAIYQELFEKKEQEYRDAQRRNQIMGEVPKILVETFFLLGVIVFAYVMLSNGDKKSFTTLGLFAFAALRLLPIMNNIFLSWTTLRGNLAAIEEISEYFKLEASEINTELCMSFEKDIYLENVHFRYPNMHDDVLAFLNLEIKKGEKVGVVGQSGSGKSTLIDMLSGMLSPSSGQMLIDGLYLESSQIGAWQKHIAYVPQDVFILDRSLRDNITLGVDNENGANLEMSLKDSCLAEVVENLEHGLDTIMSENGANFSGGQRQRIGIARALYLKRQVLILDEATSSLDLQTEDKVLRNISNRKELTIIMISHSFESLKFCDVIFKVNSGSLQKYTVDEALELKDSLYQ